MRFAELAVVLAPIAAFVLWRWAIARGLDGPPPGQLLAILAGLVVLGGWLVWTGERERLPPGRYVPAHVEDGRVVPGYTEPAAEAAGSGHCVKAAGPGDQTLRIAGSSMACR